MKKFFIIMLVLIMSVSAIIGVTSSVKHEENRKDEDLIVRASYEQLISDLENDIASSMQNVAELQAEIELNGLTISNLTTSVVTYKNQVTKLENSVEKYEEDLVVKTSELEAKTGEIAELTTQLENSEEENTELLAQIEILTEEKTSLETEIVELSSEKENLENLIIEKEAEITELSNSISAKNAELETLANQIVEKQTIINGLNTQVTNLLVEIENLETNALDKDETIENLNNQVLDLQTQVSELNSQIEELNATIFDLNIRIDVLENQLNNSIMEKDPNKMYFDDFIAKSVYGVGQYSFHYLNDDYVFFTGSSALSPGLYVLNLQDNSYVSLIETGYGYSNLVKLINDDYLVGSQSFYGVYYFDFLNFSCERIENIDFSNAIFEGNVCYIGKYLNTVRQNGDTCLNISNKSTDSLFFFDYEDKSFVPIKINGIDITSANFRLSFLNSGRILAISANSSYNHYLFNFETGEFEEIEKNDNYSGLSSLVSINYGFNKTLLCFQNKGVYIYDENNHSYIEISSKSSLNRLIEKKDRTGCYLFNENTASRIYYFFDYTTETLIEVDI